MKATSDITPPAETGELTRLDAVLVTFWSFLGGAACFAVGSRALHGLLGLNLEVARGIGFAFLWLSAYVPMKVWSGRLGGRRVSGWRYLSVSIAMGIGFTLLGLLIS